VPEEGDAGRGQRDPGAGALEQLVAQLVLQRPDLPAQGGLRDQQLNGRAAEGAVVGDGDEVAQVAELHVAIFHAVEAWRGCAIGPGLGPSRWPLLLRHDGRVSMKLGICSVSLFDHTPDEAIATALAAGYAGIEWRVTDAGAGAGTDRFTDNRCTLAPDEVARAVARCAAGGLAVIGLDTYVDSGDRGGAERALALAAATGVPWIRFRAPWRDATPVREAFAAATAFVADLQRSALAHGVRALLELHQRTICPSASLGLRLLADADPAAVGVLYDAGNLPIEGYEDHRTALELLGPHLAGVHLKNVAFDRPDGGGVWRPRWSPLDDGVVDVAGLLAALDAVGFAGWVSLEDFSDDRSPADTAHHNAAVLARLRVGTPA
jgi:sugar phosphate isomerase/epimerase